MADTKYLPGLAPSIAPGAMSLVLITSKWDARIYLLCGRPTRRAGATYRRAELVKGVNFIVDHVAVSSAGEPTIASQLLEPPM